MCVFTHTCGTRTVVACLIGGPNSLGGQSRERGGNLSPYYEIRGKLPNRHVWTFLFSKTAQFIRNVIYIYWGTIVRLGELILMLENLIKSFHAMGPLTTSCRHNTNFSQSKIYKYISNTDGSMFLFFLRPTSAQSTAALAKVRQNSALLRTIKTVFHSTPSF